jgi:riboflavin biosynthesis pyrimidine reductase
MTKPWVIAYNLASLDGRVTIAPDVLLLTGDERWSAMAGDGDAYEALKREYDPDVILEGSGSFVLEGTPTGHHAAVLPNEAVKLHRDFVPADIEERPGHRGWFVVVDGRGRVRWQYKEMEGWHLLVLACRSTPAGYLAFLREERIPYLVVGDARVDLAAALERLADRFGARRVLATGGGRLQGALLRSGLIDEVHLELAPAIIGGDATPTLFDAEPLRPDERPMALEITDVRTEHGRVSVRARVRDHERAPERADELIQASLV